MDFTAGTQGPRFEGSHDGKTFFELQGRNVAELEVPATELRRNGMDREFKQRRCGATVRMGRSRNGTAAQRYGLGVLATARRRNGTELELLAKARRRNGWWSCH